MSGGPSRPSTSKPSTSSTGESFHRTNYFIRFELDPPFGDTHVLVPGFMTRLSDLVKKIGGNPFQVHLRKTTKSYLDFWVTSDLFELTKEDFRPFHTMLSLGKSRISVIRIFEWNLNLQNFMMLRNITFNSSSNDPWKTK